MQNNFIVFAILGGLSSNIFYFLTKYSLKRGADTQVQTWFLWFFRIIIFLAILPFDFQIKVTFFKITMLLLLGILEVFAGFGYMKMQEQTDLSISTIISKTRLIWIPVLAFLFLGEQLKYYQYIGIAILFIGLSIASSPKKIFIDKGIQYSYLVAFLLAIVALLIKYCSSFASGSVILVTQALVPSLIFPFFIKHAPRKLIEGFKKDIFIKISISSFQALSGYLILVAYKLGSVSIANSIYQGMLIVSVLAGIFLLKEYTDFKKKIFGSIVTLLAIVLLTL